MWARKRLDIRWRDFLAGRLACIACWNRRAANERLEAIWASPNNSLACLSVRSGLDLFLTAAAWPAGSEILMSALTIPDMARIIRHHSLVPVPVDLDPLSAAPTLQSLQSAITPQTRAILVAHLLGTRIPLEPILKFARDHDLVTIEDCAQAFVGPQWTGTSGTLVSMFSFGTIKTATAIGGALLTVRDPSVLAAMRKTQSTWPVSSRLGYAFRLAKYGILKFLSGRLIFSSFVAACRLLRLDHDLLLNYTVRGFPGPQLLPLIRRTPSAPLLSLLHRRLRTFSHRRLQHRTQLGEFLQQALEGHVDMLGVSAVDHTYWVFPILVEDADRMLKALLQAGFDATRGSSMEIVDTPEGHSDTAADIRAIFPKIVYLPLYPGMSHSTLRRMADVVITAS